MLVLKTILFTCATVSLAAPTWFSGMESRGIDDSEIEARSLEDVDARGLDMFEDLEARSFNAFANYPTLEARTDPKFASANRATKEAGVDFVHNTPSGKIADSATKADSARTLHENANFHLDRQQPNSERYSAKSAVQLNRPARNGYSTIGQVAVEHGKTPTPGTVSAKLKHSINTGSEQKLPQTPKQDRIAASNAKKQAKTARNTAKYKAGMDRAKQGQYKKGKKTPTKTAK